MRMRGREGGRESYKCCATFINVAIYLQMLPDINECCPTFVNIPTYL